MTCWTEVDTPEVEEVTVEEGRGGATGALATLDEAEASLLPLLVDEVEAAAEVAATLDDATVLGLPEGVQVNSLVILPTEVSGPLAEGAPVDKEARGGAEGATLVDDADDDGDATSTLIEVLFDDRIRCLEEAAAVEDEDRCELP